MARCGWLLALALACAHSRQAEDASSAQAQSEGAQPGAEGTPEQGADASREQPSKAGPNERGRVAGGSKDPDAVPVATSPQGLLKPGAEKKVRERLGPKGNGGSLRQALQEFQRSHDLPATGMLDHETVEQLGLDPDDIFERAGAE